MCTLFSSHLLSSPPFYTSSSVHPHIRSIIPSYTSTPHLHQPPHTQTTLAITPTPNPTPPISPHLTLSLNTIHSFVPSLHALLCSLPFSHSFLCIPLYFLSPSPSPLRVNPTPPLLYVYYNSHSNQI